jgi:ATP-dependent helicase/nuclease subunit B
VVTPSAFAKVQLRRMVGARTGLCNVAFRTWNEVTTELGRSVIGPLARIPAPRTIDEALRQVLVSASSPFDSLARTPLARFQLVSLLYELWQSGPALASRLVEHGGRALALANTLTAVEERLAEHGFIDPGRLLDLAATAAIDRQALGSIVLWFPSPPRERDLAVLDHLGESGVPVITIGPEAAAASSISSVIRCADPDEELRVVARRVIEAAGDGVPLWRQAVIHPPLDRYRRIVHQQLAAAGIASSGRSPMTLAQSATGRALAGLLELAGGLWRRADVIGWLDSAPITIEPEGPRAPVNRWDDVSARAGVVEGLEQWRSRLQRFAAGGGPKDPYVAHSDPEAEAARALTDFINHLADTLEPRCVRWSEWAAWAIGLLDLYLHPDDRTDIWPAAELVAAQAVREVLLELGGLDAIASSTDLGAFRHAVEEELDAHSVRDDAQVARPPSEGDTDGDTDNIGLPGPVGSGVFVGSPSEARGLTFAQVYVVGLADQFLPGTAPGSSLLPESDLVGADWPTDARRADELLDDLRAVFTLADLPPMVTWPAVDPRTGRQHDRSRWLDGSDGLGDTATDEIVPSFAADITGAIATSFPVSSADRLLGELARAVSGGVPIERHPAVIEADRAQSTGLPPLRESVAAAKAPLNPGFSRFEGNVGPGRARGILGELSPTRLEQYAGCPRRYLLDRELHLQVPFRPEATEQMAPRDRGTLVHEILASYVGERIEASTPADLDRLIELADQRFSLAEQEGRCGPPLMAKVERAKLMRELRRFFEEDTLEPIAVELAFGGMAITDDVADDRLDAGAPVVGPRVDAVELALLDGRVVRFGGSIDRVDRGPDRSLLVSDYKTGGQSTLGELTKDPVVAGTKLQLPIYALAARSSFGWTGPVRARYWLTSWNRRFESLLCTLDETLATRLREVVSKIAEGIEAGAFPGVPGAETFRNGRPTFDQCLHCDFDGLCPSDRDRRWSVVRQSGQVDPVVTLGEAPSGEFQGIVTRAPVDLTRKRWGS